MLAWHAIYGSFLAVSPVGPQIRWWDPHLVDILWSSRNGLFSWSPALYLGAIGLFIFAWMRPAVGLAVLLCLGVMVYFNASIQDWWGSAGFGGRRFDGTIPLFALGAAALGERAIRWTSRRPAHGRRRCVRAARALERHADEGRAGRPGPDRRDGVVRRGWARTRRERSTAGSAIRSRIPRASSSRRATDCRSARTTCSPPTAFSGIHRAPTGAWTSAAATTLLLVDGWHARNATARSRSAGRRRRRRCWCRSTMRRA